MKYRYKPYTYRERKSPLLIRLIRRLAILSLVFISFYVLFLSISAEPEIENVESLKLIPAEGNYVLRASNAKIKEVELLIEQEGKSYLVLKEKFPQGTEKIEVRINSKSMGLKEGKAVVNLKVSSGFLRTKSYTLDADIDLTPPSLEVVSYSQDVSQGSTVAIKVKSDGSKVDLETNGLKVSMTPLKENQYFALVPVPLDGERLEINLTAQDLAGNKTSKSLNLAVRKKYFKKEHIRLTDDLINSVIYPLLGEEAKGLSPEEAFRKINEDWRHKDIQKISQICKESEQSKLWNGEFIQLPKSKVISDYGIERFYYYEGKQISYSRHMGYDFASVEQAPVLASNDGVVVFVGNLGIYGNTIIIDHGLGLFSLYGHLSNTSVKEGQFVKKGEVIGNTGKTGLAFGDHLHFGIIVHGYEVNPIYWLDARWIKNNIESILERW
ncbi:M23 family metallopeptidase [Thermocrinis jamiesonii]|uniref:M23 family metallopeptidase n=1 Tax=Thermocrinis jamiesonii TaxID=1302351 RepID=UPI00068B258F|nr:M23 family metallopeptidase [Thermocrinis jamiesonii]